MTSPPRAGPATAESWNIVVLRLTAEAMCAGGTRLGTRALRAGLSNAAAAAPTAVRT